MAINYIIRFDLDIKEEIYLLFYADRDEWLLCRRNPMLRGDAASQKIGGETAAALISGFDKGVYKIEDMNI